MENIYKMLKQTSEIVQEHEKETKENGENFNLFSILDRETDEVKTHSAIIAELLNPNGSHGQGNTFLRHFIDSLSEKKVNNSLWEKADIPNKSKLTDTQVYIERNIGKYRGIDCRLDILLTNQHFQICIENKFYAKNQEKQLERYTDYLNEDKARNKILIYLTLNGKDYPDNNEMKNGENYFCLSYEKDILNWLNICLSDCQNLPILKESINQYISLIKNNTNQSINFKMSKEIQQLIISNGIKGAEAIRNEYENVFAYLSNDLKKKVIDKLDIPFSEIKLQSEPFSSIFIFLKNVEFSVGIEGFDMKSHKANSLFIGKLNFNRKDEDKKNYWKSFWYKESIETIWDEILLSKLDEYGRYQEKRDDIAQEVVNRIHDYIKRVTHSANN
jgi:hypothetical protein